MGFETINALGHPTMLEGLVKLSAGFLQLHSRPPTVRRGGAPADASVNSLLGVDKRLFHGFITIGRRLGKSKAHAPPNRHADDDNAYARPTAIDLHLDRKGFNAFAETHHQQASLSSVTGEGFPVFFKNTI